jgi:cytochrome b561
MSIRNTTVRWGSIAQSFHWIIVALIITQFVLINLADTPVSSERFAMIVRHKSVGITILMLAIARLLWRQLNPTPLLPNTLKPYERRLAHFSHFALYTLLFVMPLSGWMMSSARNYRVSWFDLVPLPNLVPVSKPLYNFLHEAHEWLAWTLVAVAALHVLAALKHHFFLKDDVLRRMLPFTRTPSRGATE